uniref:Interleukin n=1 Tax=Sander lucioperca TaxID=283035 RepID=A0A8C9XSX9_SANLU
MEHFIRIAVWITLLTLSGCLQTKSLPISDFGYSFMWNHVKCVSNFKPNIFPCSFCEKQCITTALECVMRELNGTVKDECEDPKEYIDSGLEFLDRLIKERSGKSHALPNSEGCECERWSETPFSEFLNKTLFLLTLQSMGNKLV